MRKDIYFEVYQDKAKKYQWRMIKDKNIKCSSDDTYDSANAAILDIKDLFPGNVRIKEV